MRRANGSALLRMGFVVVVAGVANALQLSDT